MDSNNPRFKDFELVDDGTLDTVIKCRHCGEVMRFNPEMPDPEECPNYDRIDDALEMAEMDHDSCAWSYVVDLNERGSFRSHVEGEASGKVVFQIKAGDELGEGESSIFDDGFMEDFKDVNGLLEYLVSLGIAREGDTMAAV